MPTYHYKNFADSTVAVAPVPAASGVTLTLAAGGGALMPAVPFWATVVAVNERPERTNAEVVIVTLVVGDVVTMTRQADGGAARAILVGDQFSNTITEAFLTAAAAALSPAQVAARVAARA